MASNSLLNVKMSIKYYPIIPASRNSPTTVWRFFDEAEKLPEMYKPGVGWVENRDLFIAIAKGEIGDSDIISEAEAMNIIEKLSLKSDNE